SLCRHSRHADRRSHAGAGADGSCAAPSRAVRRREDGYPQAALRAGSPTIIPFVSPFPGFRQSLNFALFFFGYYGFIGVFSPYASLYFTHKGLSAAEVGVLLSLAQAVRIFGPGMWGWLGDYRQQRVALLRLAGTAAVLSFLGIF